MNASTTSKFFKSSTLSPSQTVSVIKITLCYMTSTPAKKIFYTLIQYLHSSTDTKERDMHHDNPYSIYQYKINESKSVTFHAIVNTLTFAKQSSIQ